MCLPARNVKIRCMHVIKPQSGVHAFSMQTQGILKLAFVKSKFGEEGLTIELGSRCWTPARKSEALPEEYLICDV